MDLTADLREAMADWAEPVTLPSGAVVQGVPSVASSEESLSGDSIIAGRTRTLRFVTEDVPGLVSGSLLTWSGKSWRVIQTQLAAGGRLTRAFLGAP